ncbi:MAG: lipid-A-disaccharide synthase [Ahrensia sp.]
MNGASKPIVLGIIAGERSGERLAADMVAALKAQTGREIRLVGVGGHELSALGLNSLFDADDIALVGISAVLKALPKLWIRIRQAAAGLIAAKPDAIVLVDSPDFSHRVAKRVKAAMPDVPIVKYVAPTVWAWRPGRAVKMVPTIDAVLALFPFEPHVMEALGGPPTHFVGHPLVSDVGLNDVRAQRANHVNRVPLRLLLLPGSRKSEISALIGDMRKTVDDFVASGRALTIDMPTLPRQRARLEAAVADWPVKPNITTGRDAQLAAYARADVALAASGTVLLELALAGVPAISIYRTDLIARAILARSALWSAALPNIITDQIVVHEFYDHMISPKALRILLADLADTASPRHRAIMDGYQAVAAAMDSDEPASVLAARVVASLLR